MERAGGEDGAVTSGPGKLAKRQAPPSPPAPSLLAPVAPPALLRIEAVRQLLAQCATVDEAKDIHDKAEAIAVYYRQRGASLEIQNEAAEGRLYAERRLGELLREMKIRPGRKNPDEPVKINPSLESIGITYRQSSMWQRIAAIEEGLLAQRIAEAKENGLELTTARAFGLVKPPSAAAQVTPQKQAAAAPTKAAAPPDLFRDVGELAREIARHLTRAQIDRLTSIVANLAAADEQTPEAA